MREAVCGRLIELVVFTTLFLLMGDPLNAQTRKEIILDNPSFEETEKANTPTWWMECREKGSAKFSVDAETKTHSGKACLSIQGKGKDTVASWIYKGVLYVDARNAGYKVKGGTTYEFSAWVKAEGVGGTPVLLVWESDGHKPLASHSSVAVNGDSPWQRVSCKFTTKAICRALQLRLNLFGEGRVSFDDVELAELEENAASASPNLLKNGSFEMTAIPGQPDDWGISGGGSGLGGVMGAHYTERFFDWYRIDSTTAVHGRNSFRLHRPFNDSDPDAANYFDGDFILGSDWQLSGEIESGSPYTLSCHLKGDVPDLKVRMILRGNFGNYSKEVKLSTAWERYVFTTPVLGSPAKGPYSMSIPGNMFIDFKPLGKGSMWIDAIQLERGDKPTSYAPSRKDLAATGGEKLPPVPRTDCVKIANVPKIDGLLDDECYAKLPKLDLVLTNGKTPKEATDGYLFQDGDNLYVGMKCHEREMDKLCVKVKGDDGSVWTDDSVEIFIDPELGRETYYRLSVNADGVKFDGRMLDGAWNGDWEAKTFKGADFWSVEMKMPLHCFGVTPATGSVWGVNLCRNNGVVNEYSNWSPVYDGGFHCPKRFGEMAGIDTARLRAYCYSLSGIALEPRLDGSGYDVSAKLVNLTGADRRLVLEAATLNGEGKSSVTAKVAIKDGELQKVKFGPFKGEGKLAGDIVVKAREPQSGRLLVSASAAKMRIPLPFELVPELSYYTGEKCASVFVLSHIDKAVADSGEMTVSIDLKDKEGAVLFSKSIPFSSKASSVDIPLEGLKDGIYSVFAKLTDSQGKSLGEAKESLRKLPPNPSEAKVNQMNRMLVFDGKPSIPVGQTMSVFFGGDKERKKAFYEKILSRYGQDFDTIGIYYFGSIRDIPSLLDIAQRSKLKVLIGSIQDFDYSKEAIDKLAPQIKSHPALLAWPEMLDENVANEKMSKLACDRWNWIGEADPHHVQFIRNHCVSLPSWEKFGYPGEIVEYHDYTFSSNRNGVAGWVPYVEIAGRVAKESRRPFLAMPQTFSAMQWWSRGPSAEEMEAEIYLSLVNGATIIQYYIFDQAERNLWLRVRSLTKEIKELTPALASYEDAPAVNVNCPKVKTLVKSLDGSYYLIAVNSSEEAMDVSFDLSSLDLPGALTAKLMFEDRDVQVGKGVLKDSFKGYQRHVYVLGKDKGFWRSLLP